MSKAISNPTRMCAPPRRGRTRRPARWRSAAVGSRLGSLALLVVLAVASPTSVARAHDPSAWGGIYRTRDHGRTWFLANEGRFVTSALDLAVSPADPNHLLLATDSGLLRSHNGGRDWELDSASAIVGPTFAVAFDQTGLRALASTGAGLSVQDEDATWRSIVAPGGAGPARAIVPGAAPGRLYLAGWTGLFRSDDWGATWEDVADGLPESPVIGLSLLTTLRESVLAVSAGDLWMSADAGRSWQRREGGLPSGRVDAVALDPARPERLWAAGANRLFRSDDLGATWQPVGDPLEEQDTRIRGIAAEANGPRILLTTDRGLYASADHGAGWELLLESVPAHLEARPLVRDPRDPSTLYAGFSLTPYDALWQTAADGRSALSRLDPLNLAGGAAFVILLYLAAGWALSRLSRYYRTDGEGVVR